MKKLSVLFLVCMLFLLSSCGNSTKYHITEIIIESKYFDEDGIEITEDEYKELGIGDMPYINIVGGVLNVNKKVYRSNYDGEIVFEGFGSKTILVTDVCNVSYVLGGSLEIEHNGQPINDYWWWEDPTISWGPPGPGAYAFSLFLDEGLNEIRIILKDGRTNSYVITTIYIEPME